MTTKTTLKKVWQTPQIFDLDAQNTASGSFFVTTEGVASPGLEAFYAPSS